MATSPLLFVTANLEKGHKPTTRRWLEAAVLRKPAALFLQEFRDLDYLSALAHEHGYSLIRPPRLDPRWWIVSSLMVQSDLQPRPLDPATESLISVFGSYVAGSWVQLPGVGQTVMLSVHASPTAATSVDLARWVGPLPPTRDGGTGRRARPTLCYSDLVLEAMVRLADEAPVLAAGDMNEARAWDDDPRHAGHTWGREFFERVALSGLVDVTYDLWHEERRTRFHPSDPHLQLDRVLASPSVAANIDTAELDPGWSTPDLLAQSDHAPIWFGYTSGADMVIKDRVGL
jgi:hypothetical protein